MILKNLILFIFNSFQFTITAPLIFIDLLNIFLCR
jgi:hypothetical protein